MPDQLNINYCPLCGISVPVGEKFCPKCNYDLNDYHKALKKLTLDEKIPPIVTPLLNNNTAIETTKLEKKLPSIVNTSSDNSNQKNSIKSCIKIRLSKKAYMAIGTTTIFIAFFFLLGYIGNTSEPSEQSQSYAESITAQKEENPSQQEATKQEITSTSGQKAEKENLAEKEENIAPLKENHTKKESVTVKEKKNPPQQEEQKQKVASVSEQKAKDSFLAKKKRL